MFPAPGGWNSTLHSITILHRTVGKAPLLHPQLRFPRVAAEIYENGRKKASKRTAAKFKFPIPNPHIKPTSLRRLLEKSHKNRA